ncbi:MAG: hypothetical protein L7F78_18740, partial [Syntrophales bacterium LBB04]|nr:hypothetical protein [Syntrophales bacterium LBB04]
RDIIGVTAPWVGIEKGLLLFMGRRRETGGTDGVQVKVPGDLQKIRVNFDKKGLVSSLVEMTGSLMPLIEIGRVGDAEMTHEILQVRPGRLYDQMEVVGHEHKGKKMDVIDFKRTGEKLQEFLPVVIRKEDILPPIAPAGDVIARITILYAERAAHGERVSGKGGNVKNKDLTLSPFLSPFPHGGPGHIGRGLLWAYRTVLFKGLRHRA